MRKALIIGHFDSNLWHEYWVRDGFLASAPSGWLCHIAQVSGTIINERVVVNPASVAAAVQYAIDNNYTIIIRSYTEVFSYKLEWDFALINNIAVLHAHGSNSRIQLTSPPFLISAICCSFGNGTNQASYGPGLELWDTGGSQSYATPTAGGKAALLIDENPDYNVWDVRQSLRELASYYATGWVEDGGYGKTNIGGLMQLDLAPPLEIRAVKSADNKKVTFYWKKFLQTRFNKVIIKRLNGQIIYEGTAESFLWYSDVVGSETFKIFSSDINGVLSHEESYTIITIAGLLVYVPLLNPPEPRVPTNNSSVGVKDPTLCVTPVQHATNYNFRLFDDGKIVFDVVTSNNFIKPITGLQNKKTYSWDCRVENIMGWGDFFEPRWNFNVLIIPIKNLYRKQPRQSLFTAVGTDENKKTPNRT